MASREAAEILRGPHRPYKSQFLFPNIATSLKVFHVILEQVRGDKHGFQPPQQKMRCEGKIMTTL